MDLMNLFAHFGTARIARQFLNHPNFGINAQNEYRQTSLFIAVRCCHVEMVKLLLQQEDIIVNEFNRVTSQSTRGKVTVEYRDALTEAVVHNGDTREYLEVARLLLQHEDIDIGRSLMMAASHMRYMDVFQLILQRTNIDINADIKYYRRSVLCQAARGGCVDQIRFLLMRKDTKVNQKCQLGRAPILWAITGWTKSKLNGSSTIDSLQFLLERTEIVINTHDHYGSTPLYLAARYNFPTAVRLLLERDVTDVHPKEIRREETPLSVTARKGYLEIVQLLLDHHNVDIDSKDKFGAKAIDWAEINGHHEVVRLLAKRSKMSTVTQQAETIVRLTAADAHADFNCGKANFGNNMESWKAMQWRRVEYNKIYGEILHRLLQRDDAEINSRDKDGRTLLFQASQYDAWEAVCLLLERTDIDVNCKDKFGLTPLLKASQKGHLEVMSLLFGHKDVDINIKYPSGSTPLINMASWITDERFHQRSVSLRYCNFPLLHIGDKSVSDVWSVNHLITKPAYLKLIRTIFERKDLDFNSKDRFGFTALSKAAQYGCREMVRLLLARDDIDVNTKDHFGFSPLMKATQYG